MIDDHTSRLDAACTGTGISALLIGASLVLPAVGTEGTLGSAERRRSEIFWRAGAHGVSVQFSTYAVRAAGIRAARSRLQWNYGAGRKAKSLASLFGAVGSLDIVNAMIPFIISQEMKALPTVPRGQLHIGV